MTLLEIINKCVPTERGVVNANIMQLRGVEYTRDRTTFLQDVIDICKKHYAQVFVGTHINGMNPVRVEFDKYSVSRPNSQWGDEYEALLELCSKYVIWLWDDEQFGYELNIDGSLAHSWQADPG